MLGLPSLLRWFSPLLLLLGLVALLLWGQCSFSLYGSSPHVPSLSVAVARDSLSQPPTGQPAQLHLVLAFSNDLKQACRLNVTEGEVSFEGRHWPFSATSQVRGLVLPPHSRRLVSVWIPVVLPADSLALLRATLLTGSTGGNSLRLSLRATYAITSAPDSTQAAETATYLPNRGAW
jgi:hypothetical protein